MLEHVVSNRALASRAITTALVMAVSGATAAALAAWVMALSFGSPDVMAFWPIAWGVIAAAFAAPLWLLATSHGHSRAGRIILAVDSVLLAGLVLMVVSGIVTAWGANAPAVITAIAAMGLAIWAIWFAAPR